MPLKSHRSLEPHPAWKRSGAVLSRLGLSRRQPQRARELTRVQHFRVEVPKESPKVTALNWWKLLVSLWLPKSNVLTNFSQFLNPTFLTCAGSPGHCTWD